MHELGIMYNIVEQVVEVVRDNNLTSVEVLVLQVGENSAVIPRYLHACYPAAIDGTVLQDTKLEIEILSSNAICKNCGKVYGFPENRKACPYCQGTDFEVISGNEFYIKEIRGY